MIDRLIVRFRCLPKTYKVFIIVIVFSITATALLDNIFTFADWVGVRFFPVEARWQSTMAGQVARAHIMRTRAAEYKLNYFYSIEEATDAYFGWNVSRETLIWQQRYEIKRFSDGQGLLVISASYRYVNDRPRSSLSFNMFLTDGDMISYPLYIWGQDIVGCILYRRRVHYDEDRIARDIMWAFAAEHVTSRVNGGTPIYYGVGLGSAPQYMSILGYEPDVVMSFSHSGNEYFFWYYLDAPLFSETFARYFTRLENDGVVRTRTLNLGEIIDVFDIQIVR